MHNNLVYVAIAQQTLAALIEAGGLCVENLRCLDGRSKQTVARLMLSALKSRINQHTFKVNSMSDEDNQATLIMAIEALTIQHHALQHPCIALYISRCYRLLAEQEIMGAKRNQYLEHAHAWLDQHIGHQRHPQRLQRWLQDTRDLQPSNVSMT